MGADLDVPAARARVDAAVAKHADAVSALEDAKQLVAVLSAQIEDLENEISALTPAKADALEEYAESRSKLRETAIEAYITGGSASLELSLLANSSDFDEYSRKLVYASVVAGKFDEHATRHAAVAEDLDEALKALGDAAAALSAQLVDARGVVVQSEAKVEEFAAAIQEERALLTQLMVAAANAAAAADTGSVVAGIGSVAFDAYVRAAERVGSENPHCRLAWWALAAIGRVESGHGTAYGSSLGLDGVARPPIIGPRLDGKRFARIVDTDGGVLDGDTEFDRAVGPMQFIPSTWASYVGDGVADPHNIYDAALAAGRYLCRGARGQSLDTMAGLRAAAFSYNRSTAYVDNVVSGALRYAAEPVGNPGPRVVLGGLVGGPEWDSVAATALVDLVPGRTVGDAVHALVGNAEDLPQRSSVVLIASPDEPVGDVLGAVRHGADRLLGRYLTVLVTGEWSTAEALRDAFHAWPTITVSHHPAAAEAWSEEGSSVGMEHLVAAVEAAVLAR